MTEGRSKELRAADRCTEGGGEEKWARRRMQQDRRGGGRQITSPQAEIWPSYTDVDLLTRSQPNKDLNYFQSLISICTL